MQRIASRVQGTVWRGNEWGAILCVMISKMIVGALGAVIVAYSAVLHVFESATPPVAVPEYTSDGQMKLPEHYRDRKSVV